MDTDDDEGVTLDEFKSFMHRIFPGIHSAYCTVRLAMNRPTFREYLADSEWHVCCARQANGERRCQQRARHNSSLKRARDGYF
jgi:hypothetical protein